MSLTLEIVSKFSLIHSVATYTLIPFGSFQRTTEQPRVPKCVLHDVLVAGEAQVDQIEVLGDDLSTWSRKVECVRLLRSTQVMQFENEILG